MGFGQAHPTDWYTDENESKVVQKRDRSGILNFPIKIDWEAGIIV